MIEKIAVVGLGYVGLPLLMALAEKYPDTIGFDSNISKIASLKTTVDATGTFTSEEISKRKLRVTSDPEEIRNRTFYVVAVPTPVDKSKHPDLSFLLEASKTVGKVLDRGALVVFESTVYPGVTEEVCGPALAQSSGLRYGVDFTVGYSPERINPGDREHTLERITKVVSGQDESALERVARVYASVVPHGVFRAKSIRVAEAAKVIENIQRDVNIALMNELSTIFHLLNIETRDVLAAAATKWNFLSFSPGLVGGHCIGVDPYYLTTKAEELGYHPQVILSGRRVNDGMGTLVAQQAIRMLALSAKNVKGAKVAILGITFKENVNDIRNSRVPDIVHELRTFGVDPLVADPLADREHVREEYGIQLASMDALKDIDCVIIAVAHAQFRAITPDALHAMLKRPGIVIDVKGIMDSAALNRDVVYWSL